VLAFVGRRAALGASLAALVLALVSACGLAAPSTPTTARVVAFELTDDYQRATQDSLRQAGWIEGQNLVLELHLSADSTATGDWLPELEADIAHGRPVVVITKSTAHALALKQATNTIPVVVSIADPVSVGLVSNLAHPGGNITGVSTNPFSEFGKRIEVLKDVLPTVKHLGVLYADAANPNLPAQLDAFDLGARQLGMDMVAVQARRTEDFPTAFDSLDRAQVEALYVVQDSVTLVNEAELANRATQHHIAMLCARSDWVERGCLMSYGSNSAALTEQQVNYVDKILRGARPGDLPLQLPTVFDLSVNTRTLQALGLTLPSSATPLVTEWIQ
jgi:putative ABC transport system substrate-binding protein